MIVILNNDGSLYYASKNEYVNQHSNNVNYIDFAFTDLTNEDYTTDIYCELPNKTKVILQGETQLFEVNETEYQGFRTYLSDETTIYPGSLKLIIRSYDKNDNILYSYPLTININATSKVEDEVNITNTEYQKLLSKLNNYLTKYDSHLIRKYDSLALANNDLENIPTNAYVLIDGDNYSLYKKVDGAFEEVLNSIENIEGLNDLLKTFANDINGVGSSLYLLNDEDRISRIVTLKTINGNSLIGSGNLETILREDLNDYTTTADLENQYVKKEQIIANSDSDIDDILYKVKLLDKVYKIDYRTKTSQLENDSDFLTSTQVYLKSETYTQEEIKTLINAIKTIQFKTYDSYEDLPETGESNVIYLVAHSHESESDVKDEYIWLEDESKYELIGNTDIDLSGYATKTALESIEVRVSTNENDIASLETNLTSEISARKESDTTLQASIDTEKTRATTKETEIANNLTSEISRAKSQETTLQNNIDTNSSSITNLTNTLNEEIDTLETALSNEETTRTTNDTALQTLIEEEITRAKAQETTLQTNIDNVEKEIPSKTSQLTNDSNFAYTTDLTSYYTKTQSDILFATKQDNLTASDSIDITNNVVSLNTDYIRANEDDTASTTLNNIKIGDNTYKVVYAKNLSEFTNDSGFITATYLTDNNYATISDIPTKLSELTNDSGFITKSVSNLTNYLTSEETYDRETIKALITAGSAAAASWLVVDALPNEGASNILYLVKDEHSTNDLYDEYVWVETDSSSFWEKLGNTDIDLSDYITTSELTNTLSSYALTSDIPTKTSELTNDSDYVVSSTLDNYATTSALTTVKNSIPTKTSQLTNNSNYVVSSTLSNYATTSALTTTNSNVSTNSTNIATLQTKVSTLETNINNYVLTSTFNSTLNSYLLKADLPTNVSSFTNDSGYLISSDLSNYALTSDIPTKTSQLTNDSSFTTLTAVKNVIYTKTETDVLLAEKQNTLTFDTSPTSGSTNPVTSGGVYTALSAKQSSLSTTQLTACNSGITSSLVSQISTNTTNISSLSSSKQDKLTAGDNITISNNVISCSISVNTATTAQIDSIFE